MKLQKMWWYIFLVCLSHFYVSGVIKIGALMKEKSDRNLLQRLWDYHNVSKDERDYVLEFIDFKTTADIADQLCRAVEATAKNGDLMLCIIGDAVEPRAMVAESAARELKLPYLSMLRTSDARQQLYRLRSDNFLPSLAIDVMPERVAVGEVIAELLEKYKTNAVFLLYNDSSDLSTLQSYLRDSYRPFNERKTRFRLFAKNGDNAPTIKEAYLHYQITTFILHASLAQTAGFITQANELGVCNDENYFILTGLNYAMTDPQALRMGHCNVTSISFVNLDVPPVLHLRNYLSMQGYNEELPGRGLFSKTAVWSDTIAVLKEALNKSNRYFKNFDQRPRHQTCKGSPRVVQDFRQTLIETNLTNGATGNFSFETDGRRKEFHLYVYESSLTNAWRQTYVWNSTIRQLQSLETTRSYKKSKDNRLHLRVTVYLEEPFVMIKRDADKTNLTGNDRYDGYCIDLLEKISELRNFTYEIHEVRDKTYGVKEPSGKWTGMVGELQSDIADLAVASLTVTYTRSEVLDFTVPYMHLGISILFKRPETSNPSLFHFMYPLGFDVWILTLSAYIGTAFVLWGLARLSPAEQRKKRGKFTLGNSFWFLVASLMQQGPEISPKSASTRLVTGFWWFFALIFISSYTANLAAFLTTERMITPIENADDLAKQTKIKYGTLERGSTMTFFNESKIETYEKMWQLMESQPSLFVKSSKQGINRVKTSDYAYLMESSMLEYAIERDCELIQIGGLLDQKGYAIGLQKGSPYRELISTAILHLQETTVLTELKDKWWKQQLGGGVCQAAKITQGEYGTRSVGGIFIILIAGLVISVTYSIVELIWHANKVAKSKSSDLTTELTRIIKKSWNEQRDKDDSLNRAIDELIEYKDGVPVGSYANPGAVESDISRD